MRTGTSSRRIVAVTSATLLLGLALVWAPDAHAVDPQVTKIGGEGPGDVCTPPVSKLSEPAPIPTSITGGGFSNGASMAGIAVDLHGKLFLGATGRILDMSGVVAGADTQAGPDPVAGLSASFPYLSGIAVKPDGSRLWTIQDLPLSAPPPRGLIRQVDLSPTNPVSSLTSTPAGLTAITADLLGNIYVAEDSGAIDRIAAQDLLHTPVRIGTVTSPLGIAVDDAGTVYVSSDADDMVYRLNGVSAPQPVAGGTIAHADGGRPALSKPMGLAIGYEIDGSTPKARYLYIADSLGGRIVRVDFQSALPVITTVAGGGSNFVSTTGPAMTASILPHHVAADYAGHLFFDSPDDCAVFQLDVPLPFKNVDTAVTQPTIPGTTVKPPDPTGTGSPKDATGTQLADTGAQSPNPAAGQNQTQLVTGGQVQSPGNAQAVDPGGSAVNTPLAQPAPQPTPGPAANASVTPPPSPGPVSAAPVNPVAAQPPAPPPMAPQPVAAPAPPPGAAHAVLPLPGPPPAAAPVSGSPPPPAAPQPVGNVGLAGPGGDAPTPKGAPRYAMVRADEESSTATLAMALGGVGLAAFLCLMLVAPGASSKPKPRPKGAY
jgi:hypothetical protein